MRLSEAIRFGAMLTPQAFEMLADNNGGTCAFGAALYAIGRLDDDTQDATLFKEWPVLNVIDRKCPWCAMKCADGAHVVTHLNDAHRLTREQIADWVASQEAVAEPEAVAALDPVGERVTG